MIRFRREPTLLALAFATLAPAIAAAQPKRGRSAGVELARAARRASPGAARPGREDRPAVRHGLRQPAREAPGDRRPSHERRSARRAQRRGDGLAVRCLDRGQLRSGSRRTDRRRDRARDESEGQEPDPRTDGEHPPRAAGRAQLRELRRGSASRLADGGCLHQRRAERARRRVDQALRPQQSGDGAHDHRRAGGRAHDARDLSPALRGRREGSRRADGDVLVQQAERTVGMREPVAAARAAQERVGLPRARGLRLGSHALGGPGAQRRARPRDAGRAVPEPGEREGRARVR